MDLTVRNKSSEDLISNPAEKSGLQSSDEIKRKNRKEEYQELRDAIAELRGEKPRKREEEIKENKHEDKNESKQEQARELLDQIIAIELKIRSYMFDLGEKIGQGLKVFWKEINKLD